MNTFEFDKSHGTEKIAIIGLGYVGLPLAVLFARRYRVIGFDVDEKRLSDLRSGVDATGEVSKEDLLASGIYFTAKHTDLLSCRVKIVTVPTPINDDKSPDLRPIISASNTVGSTTTRDTVVIFESTVYPGLTEEICIPILEHKSQLKWKTDFHVGYSPERINPGDKVHIVSKTNKVVSGDDETTTRFIAELYASVIDAEIHVAPNIKTAEAAKIIENTQRDLNIALINELALIFHKMGIDTREVLEAAGTKWNFHKYEPGLVGGHCISVDPYYLTHQSEKLGYYPSVILSGRRVNDNMGKYIAENTVEKLIETNKKINGANVLILGITFKENVPDIRNSRVIDIYNSLKYFHINPFIYDPHVDSSKVEHEYGVGLCPNIDIHKPYAAIILAVKHDSFLEECGLPKLREISSSPLVLMDIKGMYDKKECLQSGFSYWRL